MKKATIAILITIMLTFLLFSCQTTDIELTTEESVETVQDSTTVDSTENTEPLDSEETKDIEESVEQDTNTDSQLEVDTTTETEETQDTVETSETDETQEQEEQETLINGKTADERLDEASSQLHEEDSADHIRDNFPDIELVYSDNPSNFDSSILPFDYYYSEEVDKTFNLCGVDRTVFICDGKITETVTDEQLETICEVTPIYLEN